MAHFQLSAPPAFKRPGAYGRYRKWLEQNFRKSSCGYCLVAKTATQIDHYEPKEYQAQRVNDPLNLILACPSCNVGKLDYHPLHIARRRKKTGRHLVLDLRNENLADFFELLVDGEMKPRRVQANAYDRAVFSDSLMDLNLPDKKERRADYLQAVDTLAEFSKLPGPHSRPVLKAIRILEKIVSEYHVLQVTLQT